MHRVVDLLLGLLLVGSVLTVGRIEESHSLQPAGVLAGTKKRPAPDGGGVTAIGCTADKDCPTGAVCERDGAGGQLCVPGCHTDAQCPAGQVCQPRVCIPGIPCPGVCLAPPGK